MDENTRNFLLVLGVFLFLYLIRKRIFFFLKLSIKYRISHKDLSRYRYYLNHFTYYQCLSPKGKDNFIKRVIHFMYSKDFQGAHDLLVTEQMKILISASAIQLMFGLEDNFLSYYQTIRIYPEEFYSKHLHLHMKGGTSVGGTVLLSWKDFVEGYKNASDKYNLGLHELAHALKLAIENENTFESDLIKSMHILQEIAEEEFLKIQSGQASFLRSYAGSNWQEFFAVCIEHFFEAPEEFKKNLPLIYKQLCVLLNQDPANISKDYYFSISESPMKSI